MGSQALGDLLGEHFKDRHRIRWMNRYGPCKRGKILDENHNEISYAEKLHRETVEGYPLNRSDVSDAVEAVRSIEGVKDLNVFSMFREIYVNKKYESRGWESGAENFDFMSADLQHLPHLGIEGIFSSEDFLMPYYERAVENISADLDFRDARTKSEGLDETMDCRPVSFFEMLGMAEICAPGLIKLGDGVLGMPPGKGCMFDIGLFEDSLWNKYFKDGYMDYAGLYDFSKFKHFSSPGGSFNPSYVMDILFSDPNRKYARFKDDRHDQNPQVSFYLKLDEDVRGTSHHTAWWSSKRIAGTGRLEERVEKYRSFLEEKPDIKLKLDCSKEELNDAIYSAKKRRREKLRDLKSEVVDELNIERGCV